MIKTERRSGAHSGPDHRRSGSRTKTEFGGSRGESAANGEHGDSKSIKVEKPAEGETPRDSSKSGQREGSRDSRSDFKNRERSRDRGGNRDRNKEDLQSQDATEPGGEKKFTGRCRLFVGNITSDCTETEFKKMFEPYGEVSECYVNGARGFGFVRLDTRANTESAKRALDGTTRKGRIIRVRFAAHSAALKVKYLPHHATNELLEKAFSQFGEVERAIVIGDDRGKPTGEGIVEFARKTGAQQAMNRINNGVFLMGLTPRPIVVELLEQKDDEDGVSEKFLGKSQQAMKEREREPGFAEPGTFEFEYGQKWKDLYNLERQREEQLKRDMEESFQKLEMDMESAEQEYQTMMLRQDLIRRQEELRRLEEEMARRREMDMRRKEEELRRREMEHRGLRRDDELLLQQQQAIREMQDRRPGGAPPMPPPPAPPAALGIEKQRQEGYMRGMHGQGMGGGGIQQGAGQPQMRQSRFDQPPPGAMFGQMGNQSPLQGMQQGSMRGQGLSQGGPPGMERGQQMDRAAQMERVQMERAQMERGQVMDRSQPIERAQPVERGQPMDRGRDRPRDDYYEPKRSRRY